MRMSAAEIASQRDAHEGHMAYTCRVERGTSAEEDAYGHPTGTTWATVYEGECDFAERAEQELSGAGVAVVVTRILVHLPAEAVGITGADRVAWVKDFAGVEVANALDIREVMHPWDGVDLMCEESE